MGAPSVRLFPFYLRKKKRAVKLRKLGRSYREIAQTLRISKATAYIWTRKVKLSRSARNRIQRKTEESLKRGLIAYNKIHGKIRSEEAAKIRGKYKIRAFKEIKCLSLKNLKLIGIALYWAEGDKKNRNMFRFTNSDPFIIKIMMKFLKEIAEIPEEKIIARMHIYPQINPQAALLYWSKIANLPKTRFVKPFFQISRASKHKRKHNALPYGTLHLEVYNTELTWKMKGWIEGVSQKFNAGVAQW